jgi:hypothetical protein
MKRILFYEFSDLKRTPIPFHTIEDFNKFCEKYGLVSCVQGNIGTQFNSTNSNLYAMCLNGTKIVTFWSCESGPTQYFIDREMKLLKDFANETFSPETTFFSESKRMVRIICGKNRKYLCLVWGDAINYDYLYLTDGENCWEENMNKCYTNDCELMKIIRYFQNEIRKGLLMDKIET